VPHKARLPRSSSRSSASSRFYYGWPAPLSQLSAWSAHSGGAVIRRRFGSIRQLPSGRWQAADSAPNGRRVLAPHTFAKRADAEAWLVDRRREIDRGLWNPGATGVVRTRFDAYSSRWLANRDLKPRTAEQYQQILTTHLLPAFGEMQLAAIAPADVRDWYSDLLPGKPTMRARTYALLRAILATAITDELIDSSPCRIRGAGQTQRVHRIRPAWWPNSPSSLRRCRIGSNSLCRWPVGARCDSVR
jgi:hypothetical protein